MIKIIFFSIFVIILINLLKLVISQTACNVNSMQGECIQLTECKTLSTLFAKETLVQNEIELLTASQCGGESMTNMVCCTDNLETRAQYDYSYLLPKPGDCGVTVKGNRIFGGTTAYIGEFPWMVLIQYLKPQNRKGFNCGGVLISEQYVLTAAHCVTGAIKALKWEISLIRLGEWDIRTERDCDKENKLDCEEEDFSGPPLDITVEHIIHHEYYNPLTLTQEYDIALLRLSNKIVFTNNIKPICLPLTNGIKTKILDGTVMQIAGWGRTEKNTTSPILLKANVDGVNIEQCKQTYARENKPLVNTQICAGGEKGIDSCRGDSGGPLMIYHKNEQNLPYYYTVGVVSFGPTPCGMAGWPGVYTDVRQYTDWIIGNIRP